MNLHRLSPAEEAAAWQTLHDHPDDFRTRNALVEHHMRLVRTWLNSPCGRATVGRCHLEWADAQQMLDQILLKAVARRAENLKYPGRFSSIAYFMFRTDLVHAANAERGLGRKRNRFARAIAFPLSLVDDWEPEYHQQPDPAIVRRRLAAGLRLLRNLKPRGRTYGAILRARFFHKPPLTLADTARLLYARRRSDHLLSVSHTQQLEKAALAALRRLMTANENRS